jgi:hypothetical protein
MWIDDYIKLQFPFNPDDMKLEEAVQLKQENIPSSLFKYRNFNEYSIENLVNDQERLSYPAEFNDPFDAGLQINYDYIVKELFNHRTMENMLEKLDQQGFTLSSDVIGEIRKSENAFYLFTKAIAQFDEQLLGKEEEFAKAITKLNYEQTKSTFSQFCSSFKNGYLVTCLSEINDSILMWSHYANNHRGFCIEYDFRELGPHNPQSRTLYPVIYTDELFDATQYLIYPLLREDNSYNNLFGFYPSMSKSTQWSYEKEWRIIFPLGPGASESDRFIRVPKAKALYVGAKANNEDVEKLKEISKLKEIPIFQMMQSETSHHIYPRMLFDPNHE